MPCVKFWCRPLESGIDSAPVLKALWQRGIDIEANATNPDAPGVLLCREGDPTVARRIMIATATGARALALVTDTAHVRATTCWELLAAGAADVLGWTPAVAPTIAARLQRWAEVESLSHSNAVRRHLIGNSPPWRRVLRDLVEAGRFSTANVVLLGESGTGKEQAARLVHTLDPIRCSRPFVILDCSALVPELVGSELFGHERGAFTGAMTNREGAFALAHGGTLLLDEVGELPPSAQAQLLRVVQEGTFKRVGSNEWHGVDVRLVAATNRDLRADIEAGRFRRDLYHRLAGWVCRLPPLRDRRADLLELARSFAATTDCTAEQVRFDPAVEAFLLQRDYPGNVRDLRQLVQQMRHRHAGPDPITIGDVPAAERPTAAAIEPESGESTLAAWIGMAMRAGMALKDLTRHVEAVAIRCAYETAANYREVAERLGVSERTVLGRLAEARARAEGGQAS